MEENKLEEETQHKTKKQVFWELVRFAAIAAVIVFPIRWFMVDPFIVSGSSMVPTFENGNYLLVDEISYELGSPKRGDVAVFRYPGDPKNNTERSFISRFFDPGVYFIKRVVGLPNEKVDIKGNIVTITNDAHPEGFNLDEPYVKNISNDNKHFELKNDEYFVMGDNRTGSSDSRYWGPVKKEFFTGRALLRLLPINKISVFPGYYKQAN